MYEAVRDNVVPRWPCLYHVANRSAFPSILQRGLLSTSALLKVVGADARVMEKLIRQHRPENVVVSDDEFGSVVVRDQKPMSISGLHRALGDGLSPEVWLEILNNRVFFWLTEDRLNRFLNAKAYRDSEHLVLVLDTERVLHYEYNSIELSPINSGATKPMPHPRGRSTFTHVSEYPWAYWRAKRGYRDVAAEFCVRDGITDIRPYLIEASIRRVDTVIEKLAW